MEARRNFDQYELVSCHGCFDFHHLQVSVLFSMVTACELVSVFCLSTRHLRFCHALLVVVEGPFGEVWWQDLWKRTVSGGDFRIVGAFSTKRFRRAIRGRDKDRNNQRTTHETPHSSCLQHPRRFSQRVSAAYASLWPCDIVCLAAHLSG